MIKQLTLLVFIIFTVSCGGGRDLTRGDGEGGEPDPLSGLTPDLFILFSKNSDSIDLTLRQVSEDFSEVFFTDIRFNLQSFRVSFENESVGELDCQSLPDSTECDLVFFSGLSGSFAQSFQEDFGIKVTFQNTEGYVFDDASPVFNAEVCDSNYGPSVAGEKTTITVVGKEDQNTLVTFLFYDFGFQNQGQLPPTEGTDKTTLYYGVNFDPFFSDASYIFSGSRKNFSDETTFLEIQAIQDSPTFKRTLVCFND